MANHSTIPDNGRQSKKQSSKSNNSDEERILRLILKLPIETQRKIMIRMINDMYDILEALSEI